MSLAMQSNSIVKKHLLDGERINHAIRRMAIGVLEQNPAVQDLYIVGLQSRGVQIGERMTKEIETIEDRPISFGILDATLYRDDIIIITPRPVLRSTKLPEPIDDRVIILVDDVLYTGRTIRAALDALFDFGRPARVMVAVLVDRVPIATGGRRSYRELPIQADVVGKSVPTLPEERIQVHLIEVDGVDEVLLIEK